MPDVARTYIRTALPADIEAIVRLEQRTFDEPWSRLLFEQFINAAGFLVAISTDGNPRPGGPIDGRLLGYIVTTPSDQSKRLLHLRNLAVAPRLRGQGVGSQLLERSLVSYRSGGYQRVFLEVRASNKPAIRLYRKHGFLVIGRQPGYYGDGEPALVMARDIEEGW